jgi:DNA-binding NarL/FixJ family response regulator
MKDRVGQNPAGSYGMGEPERMQNTTVLIADDHELNRESLAVLLGREPGLEIVGSVADGRAAISMAKSLQPGVLLVDVNLPLINGLQVARQVRVDSPRSGIVMLSNHDRGEYLKEFMREDSAGKAFVLKRSLRNTRDMVRTIEDVCAGRTVLDPAMVSKLTSDDSVRVGGALKSLSQRELQVLSLMAKAFSNKAIAESLYIQPRTVEHHISSVLAKLGFNSASERHGRVFAILTFLEATGQLPISGMESNAPTDHMLAA